MAGPSICFFPQNTPAQGFALQTVGKETGRGASAGIEEKRHRRRRGSRRAGQLDQPPLGPAVHRQAALGHTFEGFVGLAVHGVALQDQGLSDTIGFVSIEGPSVPAGAGGQADQALDLRTRAIF